MILITVGTEKFPFNRLMEWLDILIKEDLIQPQKEEIIIQSGSCTFVPSGVNSFTILPASKFQTLTEKARLIIAHCGEGTIDLVGRISTPFILVPRSGNSQEHVDNHQIELANKLANYGIPIANSLEDLRDFVLAPILAKFHTLPIEYYARASRLLEDHFDTEDTLARLTEDLIDFESIKERTLILTDS